MVLPQPHLLVALEGAACTVVGRVGTDASPFAPDLVGELADFGDLAGGEHQRGVMVRVAYLLAKCMHALRVAADAVVGGRLDKLRDGCAEACSQLRRADVGVLQHAVQQAGGDEDIRAARITQQPRDFRQMLDERRAIALAALAGVTACRVRETESGRHGT